MPNYKDITKHDSHTHIIYRINHENFYNIIQELGLKKTIYAIGFWNRWVIECNSDFGDLFTFKDEDYFFLEYLQRKKDGKR